VNGSLATKRPASVHGQSAALGNDTSRSYGISGTLIDITGWGDPLGSQDFAFKITQIDLLMKETLFCAATLALSVISARSQVLYVGGYGAIHRFAPDGTDLGAFATPGVYLTDLAFDTSGNLYVSSAYESTIRKFSPAGTDLGVFATTGSGKATTMAFDSTGNLYAVVVGPPYISIVKWSPSGVNLGVFAHTGLSRPSDIAFDGSDNLYVANDGDGTVHRFGPSGEDLGVFASTGRDGAIGLAFSPVPEPSTLASAIVMTLGALALLGRKRLHRSQRARGGVSAKE
jgi:streptogramin lyase